jgi:hypothetical protein
LTPKVSTTINNYTHEVGKERIKEKKQIRRLEVINKETNKTLMNERKQQLLGQRVNKKAIKERRNKGRKTPNASLGL